MANKTNIRRLAKILSFTTLSKKSFELKELNISNLAYLEYILQQEVEARRKNRILRNRKSAKLPDLKFDTSTLVDGLKYHAESLSICNWIENEVNLLVTGVCGIGKTAFITHLANIAIDKGYKAYYLSQDELVTVFTKADETEGAKAVHTRLQGADLIIVDDFLYLIPSAAELDELYKILLSLNKGTSIALISNREIQDWLETAEDKYKMQLLIDRVLGQAELLRLYK